MARKGVPIGLDSLYYAAITEDATTGEETYATPVKLSEAMTANLSVEMIEGILYADDKASENCKEFKQAKISLKVKDIGPTVAAALTGAKVDTKGVLMSTSEDLPKPVAIGFRAKKNGGAYRYLWLYRVTFGLAGADYQTKGDSFNFATPTIEGTVIRRNKADASGNHPWKADVDSDDTNADATTISGWFSTVYEPTYTASNAGSGGE